MKMNNIKAFIAGLLLLSSCNYLDVIPDNVATVDYAFRLRSQAEKYLFTCYSYLPAFASISNNPALVTGDEIWFYYPTTEGHYGRPPSSLEVARGNQSITNPYLDYWSGTNGGKPLFQAIRDCNTFLENIGKVPDIEAMERERWIAEVKFLKAYYHWYLVRLYGPIPITDENMPISTGVDEVKVFRDPVDSCFNYIVDLLDVAIEGLPDRIDNQISEIGRVTRPIALALKARVLVTAASPLFNGNTTYASFTDSRGTQLFNPTYDPAKWERAAEACLEAIEACHDAGAGLYNFNPAINPFDLSDEIKKEMDIRNAVTEKFNKEIIWASTNSMAGVIQRHCQPYIDPSIEIPNGNVRPWGQYAPPIKVVEMFYSKNGVPIEEDKTWDYTSRYALDTATDANRYHIKPGYVTARLNFNREPRFYANLGFDGGVWYGQGRYDDENPFHVENKAGQYSGVRGGGEYSITGYYVKKLVNYQNVLQTGGTYVIEAYPWPVVRLADLYLYYAEALNETGQSAEARTWLNLVRERAGIPSVEDAWSNFSIHPAKYQSQEGLREIIQQERLIELAFEGSRFWDLRRWKKAVDVMNQPITGWDIRQSETSFYYQPLLLFNQSFRNRDYLWPLREADLIVNKNLVQNPGW